MAVEYPLLVLGYMTCKHCNFVSQSVSLQIPAVPCPQCGISDVRFVFPDFTPSWLYNSAYRFHAIVQQRAQERLESLADRIERETGKIVSTSMASELEARVRSIYRAAGNDSWSDSTWMDMARAMASALDVHDTVGMRVCYTLVSASTEFEESTATLVITCAFLESMLTRFLALLAERHGTPEVEAREQVDKLKGFGRQHTDGNTYMWYFHATSGLYLAQEFQRIRAQSFWQDWSSARRERNDIMHGKKPYPPTTTMPRVARLLDRAVPVFADLQNALCCTATVP